MNFRAFTSCKLAAATVWLAVLVPATVAQTSRAPLEIMSPAPDGWIRLNAPPYANTLLTLEASPDLVAWSLFATLHDGAFAYPDADSKRFSRRFYRAFSRPRGAADDWKNQITTADDVFRSPGGITDELRWVKFAILASDPARVYFQDSTKYPFHYDFARQRLDPFVGIDRASFDLASLYPANQQVILGAVLFPPGGEIREYGIQFVGLETYPLETVASLLELVRATVRAPGGWAPVYIPTWEQSDSATRSQAFFQGRGFPVASLDRWLGINPVYANGWTLGRLVYLPAAEITVAYADGRLRPGDVLLTDGVPAETPLVAGIVSLRPSTPNSHVAILSRSFGIPFVYLPDPEERERVRQLSGREVIVRASTVSGRSEIKILDVHSGLSAELRSELLALKAAPLLNFPVKTTYGRPSAPTDNLVPSDAKYFGGKAANYGVIRRKIPNNSPPAVAFSFDLWDQFLDQTLPGGQTLREEIAGRLAPFTQFPPDIAALKTTLAQIRNLFTNSAQFTADQQEAVIDALQSFDPAKKIRFRSSTNMEDGEQFTGAGLYDSYSGCLLDDLDDETTGPCRCDSADADERGVFRAIQRVYASFYNDNAFLERLRHGIDEDQVGMALLVHHSFPNEAANGVATIDFSPSAPFTYYTADLVTQVGEVSVTNPQGEALPELVQATQYGQNLSLALKDRSTLLPLGAYVLSWEADYRALMGLLISISEGYRELELGRRRFLLDFEYKKEGSTMVVKQVRPIPLPASTGNVIPFLINEPVTYVVFQGEYGDVFGNHRLKSQWALQTRNLRVTDANFQESFYAQSRLDYLEDGTIATLQGPLLAWPEAAYTYAADTARHTWTVGSNDKRRFFEFRTEIVRQPNSAQTPLLTQTDFSKVVNVTYAMPMPSLDYFGRVITTTSESVRLVLPPTVTPRSLLQRRSFSTPSGVHLETSFYWPQPPQGIAAGYTAPLVRWVETCITGLTTEPIILRGYYSQTYRPEHHNFTENFIFEPRLEEGISAQTVAQLAAANIQLLHWNWRGATDSTMTVLSFDGRFRELP